MSLIGLWVSVVAAFILASLGIWETDWLTASKFGVQAFLCVVAGYGFGAVHFLRKT